MRLRLRSLIAGLCLAAPALAQAAGLPVSGTVVDAAFLDLRWQPRRLSELGPREAIVVYFATGDCPMVRRYMPRLGAIAAEYLARDVTTLIANVGAGDAFVDAAAQALEFAPHSFFVGPATRSRRGARWSDRDGARDGPALHRLFDGGKRRRGSADAAPIPCGTRLHANSAASALTPETARATIPSPNPSSLNPTSAPANENMRGPTRSDSCSPRT